MTDELIEKVAFALFNANATLALGDGVRTPRKKWLIIARAALLAIEESGYAIVQVGELTPEKLQSAIDAANYKYFGHYELSDSQWDAVGIMLAATRAMLSARSKLTGDKT